LGKAEKEIMDFMAVYGEAGMIGVVGAMFVYLVVSLSNKSAQQQETLEKLKVENRGQSETLENMEGMVIKLINRWNQSDDKLDRKFDAITKEINDLDNQVSELKGSMSRINGRH
jgi:archaellum component FlaC